MRWPSLEDVVAERKAAITPSGKPTIHKRNKGERTELYLEALSSHALATAKEAFAVCPKIKHVGLAIVRNGFDPARGDQTLEPIVLAVVSRQDFDRIQWMQYQRDCGVSGRGEMAESACEARAPTRLCSASIWTPSQRRNSSSRK